MVASRPVVSLRDFLKIFELKVTPRALQRIQKAYEFSERCHSTQRRDDGTPYHTHCVETALIIALEWDIWDYEAICAALMHDSIEDKDLVDELLIAIAFSEREAQIVREISKPKKDDPRFTTPEERHTWYFTQLMKAWVISKIVKAADRLHNLRTLRNCSPEKRSRKLQETIDVYLPIFTTILETYPELGKRIMLDITTEIEHQKFYTEDLFSD